MHFSSLYLRPQRLGLSGLCGGLEILAVLTFASQCFSFPHPIENSTFYNPIFSGSYPDPSCIFLEEWDSTFFCASSSFNIFPGIPIHASKDLQSWKLISKSIMAIIVHFCRYPFSQPLGTLEHYN